MFRKTSAIVALLFASNLAFSASFDCKKADHKVEKLICNSPALSKLDKHLSYYYKVAKVAMEADACIKADQKKWLLSVRNACSDITCLEKVYLQRLSELDEFEEGTAGSNLREDPFRRKYPNLPLTTRLVWIIPAALDTVAAPHNPHAKPFEAIGTIIDEMTTVPDFKHGFVLRSKQGTIYPLVALMLIEPSTTSALQRLAQQKDAKYLVRGYVTKEKHFEPSQCVYIYRLP